MRGFVDVPSDALFAKLRAAGFVERPPKLPAIFVGGSRSAEIVYERTHDRDRRYRVLVYTSIGRGRLRARARGQDAIRVCAIYEDGERSFGVAKFPRVHRTGSVDAVLERVIERAREAYAAINERRRERPRRAADLAPLVRREDRPKLVEIDRRFDAVREKHHPGSHDPDAPGDFLDPRSDDEIDES